MAAASVACACSTDADNSSADSSATTSSARTLSPLRTLIAASWPPTSGATRTSVVRTTPTMGAVASELRMTYVATPTATTAKATAMIATPLLAMGLPPFDQECGYHRDREIDDRQNPEATPVARHLPEACAELIDADDAVDGEV